MTSYINALNTAIYSTLSGGTALIDALGGTAIYHGIAPEGRALPYVVWSYVAGGHENMTPNESVNAVIYVRAYAVDAKTAAQLDGYVAELLETTLSMTGWNNYWLAREESIVLPEIDDAGKSTWSCGAYYRVRLD
jgi:hypothetical protein